MDEAGTVEATTSPSESGGSEANGQRVLLIEDDQGLRESLATVLSYQGLTVDQAGSAEDGLELLYATDPDLVVLDINLPGQDGLGLLRRLRDGGDDRQVLLLTARHEVADRVAGLDAGADDYLPKPFALDELLARVRSMLRRAGSPGRTAKPDADGDGLVLGSLTIDRSARRVTQSDREIELTKMEYDLLELLIINQDNVLTRTLIHERIWGYDEDYGSNTLEVLVSSLRRKLEVNGEERLVHTVRGVGYVARLRSGSGGDQ